jgi:hypothetical protein
MRKLVAAVAALMLVALAAPAVPVATTVSSVLVAGVARADTLDTTTVQKEGDFHNSFAINVHPNYVAGNNYRFYDPAFPNGTGRTAANTWKQWMCDSHIPLIRAGLFGNPAQNGRAQEVDLYTSCGIRMIAQVGDTGGTKVALQGLINGNYPDGMIAAVELMNEPGSDAAGQSAWVQAMAVRTFFTQHNISLPIIGPSPTNDTAARGSGDLSSLVDECNIHPYAGGKPPEDAGVFPFNLNRAHIMCPVASGLPTVATEGGYWTFDTDGGLGAATFTMGSQPGVTERVQATYTLRNFAESFRDGIKLNALYELLDEWGQEKSDPSQGNVMSTRWGVMRGDFTPKPAYSAIKELLRYESESTTSYTPAPVHVTVTTPDNTPVHALVLARSTGRDRVLVWRPTSVYNQLTGAETPVAPVPVTLTVCRPDVSVGMYLDTEYPEDPASLRHKVGGAVPNVNGCRTWTDTEGITGELKIYNPWY